MILLRLFFRLLMFLLLFANIINANAENNISTPKNILIAKNILSVTGIKGGLIVHLGCGTGELTTALRINDRYLVHGLDSNPENIKKARALVHSRNLYGPVSVELFNGQSLPYSDNIVNLLISDDPRQVTTKEIMRVLCPRGAAFIKQDGKWIILRKPWPEKIDEWTHFLHDASNNAIARDSQVGPPRSLKWSCGPLWCRSHEFNSSLCAMVSANGRLFYVFDEGLTGVTDKPIPEKWTLIARDAFNGLLLWKRKLPDWGTGAWHKRDLRSIPQTISRRLIAHGDRVFVTLDPKSELYILNGATGNIITTINKTENTQELRCTKGIILLQKGGDSVVAIDERSGRTLWHTEGKIRPLTLAAMGGRVFFQTGPILSCRELKTGRKIWDAPCKLAIKLLLAGKNRLFVATQKNISSISAGTGKTLWTIKEHISRNELFIAEDHLWYWKGMSIVGCDLNTGKITKRLDTADVFTRGHHLRCYQSKGTEQFLITPNRGAEFISLTGGLNTENDWVRGPCRYGIMPCNGLLYAPPNPCFCYPGVKLTGFNALAPEAETVKKENSRYNIQLSKRLELGTAYKEAIKLAPSTSSGDSNGAAKWPTYRHDARRSGSTPCEVPAKVSTKWKIKLKGKISPPVVSCDHVYVAAKDESTLYALNTGDGETAWRFTAGSRIDSPPAIFGKLVLFGCTDGHVYCLRDSDGELVWRFMAAPSNQMIISCGRLESPWSVHGSILIKNGVAYFTAGRSTYLDGGIRIFGLDPVTGKILYKTRLHTWARTRKDTRNKPFIAGYQMEGALSDILVSQGNYIYLGQVKLDLKLVKQEMPYPLPNSKNKTVAMDLSGKGFFVPDRNSKQDNERIQREWLQRTQKQLLKEYILKYGGYNLGDRKIGLHVFATSGFLDDSWFNRTYWMYSRTWPGYYLANRAAKTGQILVTGPEKTFALQSYPTRNLQSPLFTPGKRGYLLFADKNETEPVLDSVTRCTPKGIGFSRNVPPVWFQWIPVRVRGMVLAGSKLFVAGPPDVVDPEDPMATFEGRKGGVLRSVSAVDGQTLSDLKLNSPPVFDGLIAACNHLFMCTESGEVICLGAAQKN